MKKSFALIFVATLLLAGCAKNKATSVQAANDPAPAVPVQEEPLVREAAPEPGPADVAVSEAQEKIEPAGDKIFFDFDSSEITTASKEILMGNSLWLQSQPEVRVRIEGHTDERGSNNYNLALGEKRAQAARAFLMELGIDPQRISIISYGEEKSVQSAKNTEIWAQDRRAEFVTAN